MVEISVLIIKFEIKFKLVIQIEHADGHSGLIPGNPLIFKK